MRSLTIATIAFACAGCAGPTWPKDEFPADMEVERTLYAAGGGVLRETCEAMVVELTEARATRITHIRRTNDGLEVVPPLGWNNTPIREDAGDHTFYHGAFGGCNSGTPPLGDLPGALSRPGAFYKVINGGEGVAIIVPRARLAGFFYFG